ncbi:hypothetical protein [Glaciihabitans sp. dw_435]|uniref:hypothetical protein n=1 Tax=Glaciihabitans sp. dw_435 TaxID=2720081 RepID=UPI001BD32CCE|nr:hypothetical protein [Glaciihabitans sp. dw_435]
MADGGSGIMHLTPDWAEPAGDPHSDGRGGDIRLPGVDLARRYIESRGRAAAALVRNRIDNDDRED